MATTPKPQRQKVSKIRSEFMKKTDKPGIPNKKTAKAFIKGHSERLKKHMKKTGKMGFGSKSKKA
jgi:hypothetical protein